MADTRSGFLTIFAPERTEVYGEFADGIWQADRSNGTVLHVLSGAAGEGTMDTFRRLNADGISHVDFTFESGGDNYYGRAQLLRPEEDHSRNQATIRIETSTEPIKA